MEQQGLQEVCAYTGSRLVLCMSDAFQSFSLKSLAGIKFLSACTALIKRLGVTNQFLLRLIFMSAGLGCACLLSFFVIRSFPGDLSTSNSEVTTSFGFYFHPRKVKYYRDGVRRSKGHGQTLFLKEAQRQISLVHLAPFLNRIQLNKRPRKFIDGVDNAHCFEVVFGGRFGLLKCNKH